MAVIDTADLYSITDASKMGVSALVHAAESGHEPVLLRNNKPVATVVSMRRMEQLQHLQEEMRDLALTMARMLTAGQSRHGLDEVLERFGYTREQLRDPAE